MAYEITVTGGKMVDDAEKELEQQGILNEVAPTSSPAPVAEVASADAEVLDPVRGRSTPEEIDGSYWDRFHTSKVRTWNPQTKQIEEQETPTWRRAARGLSTGLKNYGLTLLKTGGDEGKAWAAGIESAFGDLDSEIAADQAKAKFQDQYAKLISDAKYTPASIQDAMMNSDMSRLKLEKSELSAKEAGDLGAKAIDQDIKAQELVEKIRSAKVNEAISWTNASTAQFNAETSRFNAETSIQEVEGPDGNKYIIPYNSRTEEKGKPILKDSAEGRKAVAAAKEGDAAIADANVTLKLIDEMMKDTNLEHAVGPADARSPTTRSGTGNFEANHNTLKSQNFLNSVKQMRGMGALSDAEGAKLEAAIATLDLKMPDKAYRAQLKKVQDHYVRLIEATNKERSAKQGNTSTTPKVASASEWESFYK